MAENLVENQIEEEAGLELEQEEAFARLIQRVYSFLDWCKNSDDRRNAEARWEDVDNFKRGKQWDGIKSFGVRGRSDNDKKLHANPVDNYFKAHLLGIVGDMTDRPPDIQVKPREDDSGAADEIAKTLRRAVDTVWYRNRGDRKLEFIARRGVEHGPLIAKIYWDNTWRGSPANPFVGEARFFGVQPKNLFVDPRVKAVDEGVLEKADFVMYTAKRSLKHIRETYPENGAKVTADSYVAYTSYTASADEEPTVYPEEASALLVEFWYKGEPLAPEFPSFPKPGVVATEGSPGSEDDEPALDKEGKNGWVHKAVVAGQVLLEHRTYVYPWYPFVLEWIYPDDNSIYCCGDGYDLLVPQLVINKLNEISIEGAAMQSQGNWVTEEGNIRNKDRFQKYAAMGGSVLPVVDVGRTRREPGGNVPSSLFVHYRQELQALETICGRYDVAQGRTPRNVRAASALALLLQQAGGRVRQRSRALSSFVEQLVQKIIYLVSTYYTEERLVRVVKKDGSVQWAPVSRKDFLLKKVWTNPLTGETKMEEYVPEVDVVVTAGAETPTSRAYYSDMAMALFRLGIIDEIALLDTLQFPGWREILGRKQAVAAQQQAALQQAAAMRQAEQQTQAVPVGEVPPEGQRRRVPQPPEMTAMRGAGALEANPLAGVGGGVGGGDIEQLASLINALQQRGQELSKM